MKIEIGEQTSRERQLIQLETLLNYEIPITGSVLIIWWILPWTILYLIFLAALVALPIFLFVVLRLLFQLRKFGWFTALILFVILPVCAIPLYSDGSPSYPFYYILPLGFFALYSITLRMVISSWDD